MTDSTIIRMAEESSKALSEAHPYTQCRHVVPSYNALVQAAQENHPADTFLRTLASIDLRAGEDSITVAELRVLLAQLRIALESLQREPQSPPPGRPRPEEFPGMRYPGGGEEFSK